VDPRAFNQTQEGTKLGGEKEERGGHGEGREKTNNKEERKIEPHGPDLKSQSVSNWSKQRWVFPSQLVKKTLPGRHPQTKLNQA